MKQKCYSRSPACFFSPDKAMKVLLCCLQSKEKEPRCMGASALWALLHNNQRVYTHTDTLKLNCGVIYRPMLEFIGVICQMKLWACKTSLLKSFIVFSDSTDGQCVFYLLNKKTKNHFFHS